ncbi:hypothetical protein UFOVP1040_20 [uncultured Caudovirales phage]|uniref:Uncharacterized protein n=1 Tax=uncultured Caudovirales phage TaxID=2100421 RepID=A0A6J5Q7I9_9CAUD|nr:hypothetical protein UFOVP1040_20 [uncultured Caudovirales phage]
MKLTPLAVDTGLSAICAKIASVRLFSANPEEGVFLELAHPDYSAWHVDLADWTVGDGRAVFERRVVFRTAPGEVQGWYALDAAGALVAYDKWGSPVQSTEFGGGLSVVVALNMRT